MCQACLTGNNDATSQLKITCRLFSDNLANYMYFRTVNDSIVFESQATKAHANMLS